MLYVLILIKNMVAIAVYISFMSKELGETLTVLVSEILQNYEELQWRS
jgi:hypothetical protein